MVSQWLVSSVYSTVNTERNICDLNDVAFELSLQSFYHECTFSLDCSVYNHRLLFKSSAHPCQLVSVDKLQAMADLVFWYPSKASVLVI